MSMKKAWVLVLCILVFTLIVACAPVKEFPVGDYSPPNVPDNEVKRPEIIRTVPPPPPPKQPEVKKDLPEAQNLIPFRPGFQEAHDFKIGFNTVMFSNQSIGPSPFHFSKYEFPEMLKSRNVLGGIDPVGGHYEQFLRLLGGRILFTSDEYDNVGTYLFYEDGEDIFEYEFSFLDGTFIDFIEGEIMILGNTYTIEDATKKDVVLINTETGDLLVIGGGPVKLNGEVLAKTDSKMLGTSLFIVAKANSEILGDNIYITPGKSLQQYLGEPVLLTNLFDITYIGDEEVPSSIYDFHGKENEIEMRIAGPFRGEIVLPLARPTNDGFRLGDDEGTLHSTEAANETDRIVKQGDYFVLTSPDYTSNYLYNRYQNEETGSLSILFQYKKINTKEYNIEIVSKEGFALEAYYVGQPSNASNTSNLTSEPGVASGFIPFAGESFKFTIGSESEGYPLAIDLNGDGLISGKTVSFVVDDGILQFPKGFDFNSSANFTLTLLDFSLTGLKEEVVNIQFNPGLTMTVYTDLELFDMGDDNKAAVNSFGTKFYFFNQEGDDEFEDITIDHPLAERLAHVLVEAK